MDLSIPINDTILSIRVTVLVETPKGYIFEKDKYGFFFPVGGRVKINETSIDAAKREVKEELKIDIDNLSYIAALENFFHYESIPCHEISTIYHTRIEDFDCPCEFYVINSEKMENLDIKPIVIKEIIKKNSYGRTHYIIRENEILTGHPCPTLFKTGAN